MNNGTLKKLGQAIAVGSFLLTAVVFIYFILILDPQLDTGEWLFGVSLLIFLAICFLLSWLIISRSPRNVIGWLFITAIALFSLQMFGLLLSEGLGIQNIFVDLTGNLWLFALGIPLSVLLLYFPTGRLISNRWRVILFADAFGMLVLYVSFTLEGVDAAWTEAAGRILLPLQLSMVIGMLGSLASVIFRYRKSTGAARAQIKWLVFMAAVGIAILLLGLGGMSAGMVRDFGVVFFFFPPIMIALAIGFAILRYRLYDIDIIIRRTLSYSILTIVLVLVYFGGIVVLQNVFAGLFGVDESPLTTVLSTLAIAALFNPLRSRIQEFIDRRFFRSKYDAEKALSDFSAVARDEVDMVRLSGSLLAVVENTMQPEQTSLWLRGTRRGE